MSDSNHVTTARDAFNASARAYVDFVGTAISPATESPVDRSLLEAFVELVKERREARVGDLGCGPGRVARFLADRGLDPIGIDVSEALIDIARRSHPDLLFEVGSLNALPLASGVLGGVVSWYSIIFTPLDHLGETFDEFARVLLPGGFVLVAFQANSDPLIRDNAFGTGIRLTNFRHDISEVTSVLETSGFELHTTVLRAPDLEHETSSQGLVIASKRSR